MNAAPKRAPFSRRGEQAIQANQEAALADAMARTSDGDDVVYAAHARFANARAAQSLVPAQPVAVRTGEAVTWENQADELAPGAHARIVDTLASPTMISVGASQARTSAAMAVDVLEAAVDAAQSTQASNSIEKMLCHQMAAAHFSAMRHFELSANPRLPPVEVARHTNAAARLIDGYQAGCLTLQKLQSGGTQRVLVQHQQVNVGAGGRAVVAGHVGRGSRTRGDSRNMRDEPHAQRRGWLKNGNPPGDYQTAPRCRALTRGRKGCRCPARRLKDLKE